MEIERRALRRALRNSLVTNTLPAIRAAQDQLREWVRQHPEDYVMRDAGESLALTEDALLVVEQDQSHVSRS